MKKRAKLLLVIIGIIFVSSVPTRSHAEINSSEASLISAAYGTYEYKGSYYKFKQTYINQGIEYLDRADVNLTPNQAKKAKAAIPGYVPTAIAKGYMYKVSAADEAEEKDEEKSEDVSEGTDSTTEQSTTEAQANNTGNQGSGNQGSGNQGSANQGSAGSNVPGTQSADNSEITKVDGKVKSKKEALKEATDLVGDFGIKVSYDSQKKDVLILDNSGNVVMNSKGAVKNTGFRLNSILYLAVGIVLLLIAAIIMSFKFELFEKKSCIKVEARGEEDEE